MAPVNNPAISDGAVQGTPLAAVNDGSNVVVFYQVAEGNFRVYIEPLDGSSIQEDPTTITTITGSPIAATVIPHRDGPKIHAYYLDKDFILTTWPDFLGKGKPHELSVKANPNAGLAVVTYTVDEKFRLGVPPVGIPVDVTIELPVLHITVYYQDFATNNVYGLTWSHRHRKWGNPELVPVDPLVGTALAAAVSVKNNEVTIRLYYQDKGITLQESVFDGKDWSAGSFQPGDIALQGPLATTSVIKNETILVYFRKLSGRSFAGKEPLDPDSGVDAVAREITKNSKYRHTAVQVGETLRFYYQDNTGNLYYRFSDLDGENWKNKPKDKDEDDDD